SHLITARITPSGAFCRDAARCSALYDDLLARARALPGVETAALADNVPFNGIFATVVAGENSPCTSGTPCQTFDYIVSPQYLSALRIPLLAGRDFSDADRSSASAAVMVSRKLAERLWPGESPLGRRLRPSWMDGEWFTVVGVVAEVRPYGM